jgi:hypothetical protein
MIEATDWKVRIDRPVYQDCLNFYVWRRRGDYSEVMQSDGLLFRVKDGDSMPAIRPTFVLAGYDGRQMMHALAEALSEEGIRSPNDHAIRGQLEAQTAHLNDLRTLLKLNKLSGDQTK